MFTLYRIRLWLHVKETYLELHTFTDVDCCRVEPEFVVWGNVDRSSSFGCPSRQSMVTATTCQSSAISRFLATLLLLPHVRVMSSAPFYVARALDALFDLKRLPTGFLIFQCFLPHPFASFLPATWRSIREYDLVKTDVMLEDGNSLDTSDKNS